MGTPYFWSEWRDLELPSTARRASVPTIGGSLPWMLEFSAKGGKRR